MTYQQDYPSWKDKILFTPGPLTTSQSVKLAMLRDLGARDDEFIQLVRAIREKLLDVAELSADEFVTILMQGCGTFGLESVVSSVVPEDGKLLVISNGAYGKRIAQIARRIKIKTIELNYPENCYPSLDDLEEHLKDDPAITHVEVVHCETTSGIVNPIEAIGKMVQKYQRSFIVDAMSSFGAMPIDFKVYAIDYLISSANKCIEGVPGFSFIIANREKLEASKGSARSLSFDLLDQLKDFEGEGHFRYTPATHTLLAFWQALQELDAEGGVSARGDRYKRNYETLVEGMRAIGFQEYLPTEQQGYIITTFLYPDHPNFDYETFYRKLREKDQVIYSGKVSDQACFRIGTVGRIFESDVHVLLALIQNTLQEMNVDLQPITTE
jgi:2-aminoethylphosphonate-pyruvate transaminase